MTPPSLEAAELDRLVQEIVTAVLPAMTTMIDEEDGDVAVMDTMRAINAVEPIVKRALTSAHNAGQEATREAACKTVCLRCQCGVPLLPKEVGKHFIHNLSGERTVCDATAIRAIGGNGA